MFAFFSFACSDKGGVMKSGFNPIRDSERPFCFHHRAFTSCFVLLLFERGFISYHAFLSSFDHSRL